MAYPYPQKVFIKEDWFPTNRIETICTGSEIMSIPIHDWICTLPDALTLNQMMLWPLVDKFLRAELLETDGIGRCTTLCRQCEAGQASYPNMSTTTVLPVGARLSTNFSTKLAPAQCCRGSGHVSRGGVIGFKSLHFFLDFIHPGTYMWLLGSVARCGNKTHQIALGKNTPTCLSSWTGVKRSLAAKKLSTLSTFSISPLGSIEIPFTTACFQARDLW